MRPTIAIAAMKNALGSRGRSVEVSTYQTDPINAPARIENMNIATIKKAKEKMLGPKSSAFRAI